MDCERFESTLIDELYDELDELTSAASKRHVAGCARCASLLSGLKATRRVAVLPLIEAPAGLEERILAAERDARKVVPLQSRLSGAVSWAGNWAMRPQTAMAAVFLLMIGSTVLLVRGPSAKAPASSAMVVTEEGAPAIAASAAGENQIQDLQAAAATAHGPLVPAATPGFPGAAASATALADKDILDQRKEGALGGMFRSNDSEEKNEAQRGMSNAGAPAGAPAKAGAFASPPSPAAPMAQSAAAPSESPADFNTALTMYRVRRYDEATRMFDVLAGNGDTNAALFAARSVRDSNGCGAAVTRFDQVGARAYGTQPGYDATLEGGRCYRAMGSFETARTHFVRLLTVPSHAALAQTELDAMSPKAAAAAAAKPAMRSAPPSTPKASPPAATDNGF
ncbi:MAG: hypothetical protein ABIP39_14450 [Polyangiaceae bacterium]